MNCLGRMAASLYHINTRQRKSSHGPQTCLLSIRRLSWTSRPTTPPVDSRSDGQPTGSGERFLQILRSSEMELENRLRSCFTIRWSITDVQFFSNSIYKAILSLRKIFRACVKEGTLPTCFRWFSRLLKGNVIWRWKLAYKLVSSFLCKFKNT